MKLILVSVIALVMSMSVQAATCELTIDSNDQMRFSAAELVVPANCERVRLTLTHSGRLPRNARGHNWVLAETDQVQGLSTDAMRAGVDQDYVPADDPRVLAATGLIGGGEQTSVEFSVTELRGRDLTYFCSFPGHSMMMRGKLIIEG